MSGKGSTPRPIPDRERYEANWEGINWNARVPVVQDEARQEAEGDGAWANTPTCTGQPAG